MHIHIKQSNCSQAAANIWAITYYFTAKSFMYITGIVLGGRLTIPWPAFLWPIKHFVAFKDRLEKEKDRMPKIFYPPSM